MQHTRLSRLSAAAVALALGSWSVATTAATAAPKPAITKAQSIAAQAKTAYDAAQYDRALDLYRAAHRADPSQTALLYAAARDAVNLKYGLGWTAVGLGAAAAGAGTWLYIKGNPQRVTVVPVGAGALLQVAF